MERKGYDMETGKEKRKNQAGLEMEEEYLKEWRKRKVLREERRTGHAV